MKLLMTIPILFFLPSLSYAKFEVAMFSKFGNYTYVDADSIKKNGNFATMWSMTDLKNPDSAEGKPYSSLKMHVQYDCPSYKRRFIQGALYSGNMGEGNVVSTTNNEPWEQISPGAIDETLLKIACGFIVKNH